MKTIVTKRDHLFVEYSGTYELRACLALMREIADTCRRESIPRVLCDVRGMLGEISIWDGFQLAVTGAEAFRGLQLAGVYWAEDLDSLPELVIQNRGGNVRVFRSIEEAKAWLGVE
jgi:hypothetical protein